MRKRSGLVFIIAAGLPLLGWAQARRPPAAELRAAPVSVLPRVEKLPDRYRLTIPAHEPLPHYLMEKSQEKIWLRLVRPTSDPSQILEGDTVVREVRLVRRAYSADVILKMGDDAISNDVYFDEGKKNIVIDVFTSERVSKMLASPIVDNTQPVLKAKKSHSIFVRHHAPTVQNRHPGESRDPGLKAAVEKSSKPGPRLSPGRRDYALVVIDAGHGGMDSGAIGTRGTMEKNINLDFAKLLAKSLTKEKNVRVVMTRDSDDFIPLGERTRIANEAGADLFISIHCNSSLSPKNEGFETYFLSPDATDKAATAVARLENSVVALEAETKADRSSRLNEMLASMAVGNFLNESAKFASIICRNIRRYSSEERAETKEADFFVLRGAQMPAVLVELQYLSNPMSEFRLRSSRYRSQLAKGILEGVKSYQHQARQEREAMASQISKDALISAP